MAEAIHCPSCSTRYRLRPERLRPAIRRAQCFTCGNVFPVGDVVHRLLAGSPAATATFDLDDVAATLDQIPPPASSLTLGDLEGVDSEIMEKTLVDLPLVLPEIKAEAGAEAGAEAMAEAASAPAAPVPAAPVREAGQDTLTGSFSSAREAINKLFGALPAVPPAEPKASPNQEMEATLEALEATLAGNFTPPAPLDEDTPTASGRQTEASRELSNATVRLSQEDLRAALQAGRPEEPTQSLRPADLRAALEAPSVPPIPPIPSTPPAPPIPAPEAAPKPAAEDPGAEQLRLKIDDEIYPGLTMVQLAAWIEEGRILEHHLVARQHSENWIEANKVPGLRPVFERMRRTRSGGASTFDASSIPEIAPKKSLFGGLFNKG